MSRFYLENDFFNVIWIFLLRFSYNKININYLCNCNWSNKKLQFKNGQESITAQSVKTKSAVLENRLHNKKHNNRDSLSHLNGLQTAFRKCWKSLFLILSRMELPKLINNINERVVDDLKSRLSSKSKVSIAAASFSIYAFEALKKATD